MRFYTLEMKLRPFSVFMKTTEKLVLAILFFGACSKQANPDFEAAAKKKKELSAQTLSLWQRSPTSDKKDFTLTVDSDLEQVPRADVSVSGILDSKGALESEDLVVYDSNLLKRSVSFYQWAGTKVPWDKPDFELFMAYHHAKKALALAKELFPNANYGFKIKDASGKLASQKLIIYAEEIGSPFLTSYSPDKKSISFYRDINSTFISKFNPVLEGDAVYHELAHYVLHSMTCTTKTCIDAGGQEASPASAELGKSPDMDALQEGLADYFASVVAGDDINLTFFANNARILTSTHSRMGIEYYRSANNAVRLPEAFRQQMHFDGRIVSGVLNDLRKYLDGTGVFDVSCPSGSSSSSCIFSGKKSPLAKDLAMKTVLKLAFNTFTSMREASSFYDYFQTLRAQCAGTGCPDPSATVLILDKIFKARGVLVTNPLAANVSKIVFNTVQESTDTATSAVTKTDIYVEPTLAWKPYPDNSDNADKDSYLEPCELIMVYPVLSNLTDANGGAQLQVHSINAELLESSGFATAKVNDKTLDFLPIAANSGKKNSKFLGWLNPGEQFTTLLSDYTSRFYSDISQSTFTRKFGKDFNVPSMGWIVHAPNTFGATGKMKIKFSGSVFNQKDGLVYPSSTTLNLELSTLTAEQANSANSTSGNSSQIVQYNCSIGRGTL